MNGFPPEAASIRRSARCENVVPSRASQQPVQRAQAQPAHRHQLRPHPGRRQLQRQLLIGPTGPLRAQQAHPLTGQPTDREPHHGLARRIQPLHIVDHQQHRRSPGQHRDRRPEPGRNHPRLRRSPPRLVQQQRHPQRPRLRPRQLTDHRLQMLLQQVGQPGKSQRQLALGGHGLHHREPAPGRQRRPHAQQRGLAHPRRPGQHQRPRPAPQPVHKPAQRRELRLPAQHLRRHRSPPAPFPESRPHPRPGPHGGRRHCVWISTFTRRTRRP